MSQNTALNSTPDLTKKTAGGEQPAERTHLEKVHQTLRGRYHWVVLLGLLGLVGGAVFGWTYPTPQYRSTGLVEIKPLTPRVLSPNDSDRLLPQFDAYVKKQMSLIEHQDVLRPALESEEWQAVRHGTDDTAFIRFKKPLELDRTVKTQIINVYYSDPDPKVAQKAIEVILKSYMKLAKEEEQGNTAQVYDALRHRVGELEDELTKTQVQINNANNEVSTAALDQLYNAKVLRGGHLEESLDQVRMTMMAMQDLMNDANTGVSMQTLAASDAQMRQYLEQRFLVEQEILRLMNQFGSEHRVVREKKNVLAGINDMINLYLLEAQTTGAYGANTQEITRLRAQELALENLVERVKKESTEIDRRRQAVAQLLDQKEMTETSLKQVKSRLDEMSLEAAAGGRISIVSNGDLPAQPFTDKRVQMSFAMAVFGLCAGVLLVYFVGYLDPRIRSFEDATTTIENTPVLGILPWLPLDLDDREKTNMAAHCVHNIRSMMQIGANRENQKVFSVTSAGPESGKTSLCMALGLSFAGTGAKTLLIDCDLVGGGLTRRAEAIVPNTGEHALVRNGLVSQGQLEQGAQLAREQNRYLIEVLVELGHLLPRDVDRANRMMDEGNRGLHDVIKGQPLQSAVRATDVPNLSLLPVGHSDEHDISRLSLNTVRQLLTDARQQFDTIIVDTGPTPGSLEASLVGSEADGVVVVVTRGEDRMAAERAVRHLRSFGAKVIGMVFNRADAMDMERSGASSVSRRSIRPDMPHSMSADATKRQAPGFDPLGSSVVRDLGKDV
ncbi:MAG: hypothetical protein IT440_12850 [Phycisphaeraceae bacterium]|nr:hypothetical protein [Phycisphaeraceae bacterium]